MRFSFRRITQQELPVFQDRLEALELGATYPLGADTFRISHGADYFAFFARLGELHYHAALAGPPGDPASRLAAVGAGVIRSVPFEQGGRLRRTWYLCDLKAHPDFRGQRLPLRMLSSAFWLNYLRCSRGYAISMNPSDGSPNRIVRLLAHFRWAPARLAASLELYSFDQAGMLAVEPVLRRHRGPVSYLPLEGKKEIILTSTGRPMKLLHAQWGPSRESGLESPQEGFTHMFCAPAGDALALELRALGHAPGSTASVIAHRMKGCDWRFALTSDI